MPQNAVQTPRHSSENPPSVDQVIDELVDGQPSDGLAPHELFFSTTDSRGVIRTGNSVFARVSGYTVDELVGSPHNVVRHPDMPAGVFRLMWSWLEAGHPVGTYVCNRTKDGGHYWVHAVVSPLHDGYLSVRMAPRPEALEEVRDVYGEALAAEQEAAAGGASRREVAEVGEQALLAALVARGHRTYEDFIDAALPAEVQARSHVATSAQRPDATGAIGQVLTATLALDAVLDDLVARLADYQRLGEDLAGTADRVLRLTGDLQGSVVAAQEASALVADRAPVLANVAKVMALPMSDAITQLQELPTIFEDLRGDIASLRFQISLATLYTDMAAAFAAEVHDGEAPADALAAVPLLGDAVETCVEAMSQQVETVNADLQRVATISAGAGTLFEDFRRAIGQWRHLVLRHARVELGEQVAPIDEQVNATWSHAEDLARLSTQASSTIVAFDAVALREHLQVLREATPVAAGQS